MNTTHLKIITPNKVFYDDKIDIVTVRTTEGEIGLTHSKSPLVASLAIGELIIGPKKNNKICAVAGGLVFVTPTTVTIVTDAIEYKEDIDMTRAEKAREKAIEKLKAKMDLAEEIKTKFALERALNRLNVKKGLFD